jgi:hypothetical protein
MYPYQQPDQQTASAAITVNADITPPNITVTPNGGNITPSTPITITVDDKNTGNSGISEVSYHWIFGTTTDTSPHTNSSYSNTLYSPSSNGPGGQNTLVVYAKDNSPQKNNTMNNIFYYSIVTGDTTPPKITVTPNDGSITYGSNIKVSASDTNNISLLTSVWDDDFANGKRTTSSSMDIAFPFQSGTHTLKVAARDASPNSNPTDWEPHVFTIGNSTTTTSDKSGPNFSISSDYDNIIVPGSTIYISVADDNGLKKFGYGWDTTNYTYRDDVAATTGISTTVFNVKVPDSFTNSQTHTLYLYAIDNSANSNNNSFSKVYTVNSSTTNTPTNPASSDLTPPTLSMSQSTGSIASGATITVTAADSSGIYDIGYAWNSETTRQVLSNSSSTNFSTTITVPNYSGTNVLKVYARDKTSNYNPTGWIPYTYTIGGTTNNDTTAPTLTLNKTSGTLQSGETITITAADSSGIYDIGYAWNSETTTQVLSNSSSTTFSTNIPVPNYSGSNVLKVYARDNTSAYNFTGWKPYTYTIGGTTNNDTTAPTLTLNKTSGTLQSGETITITAADSSGIYDIGYAWNSETTRQVLSNSSSTTFSTTITVPNYSGSNDLRVYARDKTSAYNPTGWNSYRFTIASTAASSGTAFSDVSPSLCGNEAYTAITEMAKRGIITGYNSTTFGPNDPVTRAQFAKMMDLALNISLVTPSSPTFKDVPTSSDLFPYTYVESAKSYLTGYSRSDGMYFDPNGNALREDMAYALVVAKGYKSLASSVDANRLNTLYTDASNVTSSLAKYIVIAYDKNIIKGYPDQTFKPQGTLTRSETAILLYRVIFQSVSDGSTSTGEKVPVN